MNSGCLDHGSDGSTGDNARTRSGWFQQNSTSTVPPDHLMRDGIVENWHLVEALPCPLGSLSDRFGNFVGFSVSNTDTSLAISDNNDSAEAESASASDHFGDPIDMDDRFLKFRLFACSVAR